MCALPYQQHPLPHSTYAKPPVTAAMWTKDDALTWFRSISGSTRIDTLCALLDSCLPLELRFIATVIEVLGKKDFMIMRDPAFKANNFYNRTATVEENKRILLNHLKSRRPRADEIPKSNSATPANSNDTNPTLVNLSATTLNSTVSNESSTISNNNTFQQSQFSSSTSMPNHSTNSGSQTNLHLNSPQETQGNRPNPTQRTDRDQFRTAPVFDPPKLRQQRMSSRNHSPVADSNAPQPLVNGASGGSSSKSNYSSDEEENLETDQDDQYGKGSKNSGVLNSSFTRMRITLYLAFLHSYNHEAATIYYSLLSQVDSTVGNAEWLERLDDDNLDEVLLLYTLGVHHPAFSFEQRIMLSQILSKVKSQLARNKCSKSYPFYPHVQVYDPYYAHYYYQHLSSHNVHPNMVLQGTPPQAQAPVSQAQGSTGGQQTIIVNASPQNVTVDTSRLPPQPQPRIGYYPQQYLTPTATTPYSIYMGSNIQAQQTAYIPTPPIPTAGHVASSPISSNPSGNIPSGAHGSDAPKPEKIPLPLHDKPLPTNSKSVPVRVSCFNCGAQGHHGFDCPQSSIEKMTYHFCEINFAKEGDET